MVETTNGSTTRLRRPATGGEVGVVGLRQSNGVIREEWKRELVGSDGRRTFSEMERDPVCSAVSLGLLRLIESAGYHVKAADDGDEEGEEDTPAKQAAQFVEECLEDTSHTWQDFMGEWYTTLIYGWSGFEIVYKLREGDQAERSPRPASKFSDGKLGWRKFAPRAQDTLHHWEIDEHGGVQGLWQKRDTGGAVGQPVQLPIEKLLLFRTTSRKNNPEGRALECGMRIPTPDGWTTIGEIGVGDRLYDETGKVRYVTWKSPVWKDRPVYRVRFTNGGEITADAAHLWSVTTANDRAAGKTARTVTTEAMAEALDRNPRQHYCVGTQPTLDGTERALPVDPYVLGAWLGDGVVGSGKFAVHVNDEPHLRQQIEDAGYVAKFDGDRGLVASGGLRADLRHAGVILDKHIPETYLRASVGQRLALLQGLMDTDGTAYAADDKAVQFFSTNEALIRGVSELVRTLGGVPRVKVLQRPGRSGGIVDGRPVVARRTLWGVRFFLPHPAFRLPRKLALQDEGTFRTKAQFVESVEPMGSADTVCIEVDAPSHLFLAGECMAPTHNSIYWSAYDPWYRRRKLGEIAAIGVERNVAGIPLIRVPSEVIAEGGSKLEDWRQIGEGLRMDETAYALIPSDVDEATKAPLYGIELMTSGTGAGTATQAAQGLIADLNLEIAVSVLMDVIWLGHEKIGTQALAAEKRKLLDLSVQGLADSIAAVFTRYAIPRLMRLNGIPREVWPSMEAGQVGEVDLAALAGYVKTLADAGMAWFPDEELANHFRRSGNLPEQPEDFDERQEEERMHRIEEARSRFIRGDQPAEGADDEGQRAEQPEDEEEDDEKPKRRQGLSSPPGSRE